MNRISSFAAVGVLALIAYAPPASARSADEGYGPGTPTSTASPYATPLAALGGQALAQYLADHQARRLACCGV